MENGNKPIHPTETIEGLHLKKQYQTVVKESGLTKKEHYAGLAMAAMISNIRTESSTLKQLSESPKNIAKWSVSFADELLKELEK